MHLGMFRSMASRFPSWPPFLGQKFPNRKMLGMGTGPEDPNPEIGSRHIGALGLGLKSGPVVPTEWLLFQVGGRREPYLLLHSPLPPTPMRSEAAEAAAATARGRRQLVLTQLPTHPALLTVFEPHATLKWVEGKFPRPPLPLVGTVKWWQPQQRRMEQLVHLSSFPSLVTHLELPPMNLIYFIHSFTTYYWHISSSTTLPLITMYALGFPKRSN